MSREALAVPGVIAVWTGDDVRDISPVDYRDPAPEPLWPYRQPILANKRVRYVGEPVAAVFANDAYVAEDAAELVNVQIEALPVILSASEPPSMFDDLASTKATVLRHTFGDIDRAFAKAHTIVELALDVGRHSACPWKPVARSACTIPGRTCCVSMAPPRSRIAIG